MTEHFSMHTIGTVHTDFKSKFGIPRQSMLSNTEGKIIMQKEYNSMDAFKGLEGYSHIWILFVFSQSLKRKSALTVRPPRLGGNKRVGVFASRAPFRPNPIGLSLVKLLQIEDTKEGVVLTIQGADLVDGTPILDIKPYLPHIESVPHAQGGFAIENSTHSLHVIFDENLLNKIHVSKRAPLLDALRQDPRPAYQTDSNRVYGFPFSEYDIRFKVENDTLTVLDVVPL